MSSLGLRCQRLIRNNGSLFYSSLRTSKFEFKTPEQNVKEITAASSSLLAIIPNTLSLNIFKIIIAPIDLRSEKVSSWWRRKACIAEMKYQEGFLSQNMDLLGEDLAYGQLILNMGGSVRFAGKPWMKSSKNEELPKIREDGWQLRGIDFSGLNLYYDHFVKFNRLKKLTHINVSNSPHFDDLCLDYLCGAFSNLETLDISGCRKLTWRGLLAVFRLRNLSLLKLADNPALDNVETKFLCIELESLYPNLKIEGLDYLTV